MQYYAATSQPSRATRTPHQTLTKSKSRFRNCYNAPSTEHCHMLTQCCYTEEATAPCTNPCNIQAWLTAALKRTCNYKLTWQLPSVTESISIQTGQASASNALVADLLHSHRDNVRHVYLDMYTNDADQLRTDVCQNSLANHA